MRLAYFPVGRAGRVKPDLRATWRMRLGFAVWKIGGHPAGLGQVGGADFLDCGMTAWRALRPMFIRQAVWQVDRMIEKSRRGHVCMAVSLVRLHWGVWLLAKSPGGDAKLARLLAASTMRKHGEGAAFAAPITRRVIPPPRRPCRHRVGRRGPAHR